MYNPRPGDKNIVSDVADVVISGAKAMDEYVFTPVADVIAKSVESVGEVILDSAAQVVSERARVMIEDTITQGLEYMFGENNQTDPPEDNQVDSSDDD